MEYTHRLVLGGKCVTLTWVDQVSVDPARVYALAFTAAAEMLLVSGGPDDTGRWLPGGGVEPGETPEQALRRELLEEADAAIEDLEELGAQRVDDPDGRQAYHRFYWCRVRLAPQAQVRAESTLRHLVSPADFLDTLEWGRSDPAAALLLARALEIERRHSLDP